MNTHIDVTEIRSEKDILDLVERGKGDASYFPHFLALLEERHPVYTGIDSSAVTRIRGVLIQVLAYRALPDTALPFVLAELESAFDPWLTAVAAAALRKRPEPSSKFVEPLLEAILYIRHRDDLIYLDSYGGYNGNGKTTTALQEIFQTLSWLGNLGQKALPYLRDLSGEIHSKELLLVLNEVIIKLEASSTSVTENESENGSEITRLYRPLSSEFGQIRLQDQSGAKFLLSDFFVGQPTVVVFFFTRCGNPSKCPLTITKLSRLQERLREMKSSIRTVAITYDPDYDDPRRLKQYARSWGVSIDENHRLVRALDNQASLRDFFKLGVSYGKSTVNQHQLETYLLDQQGTLIGALRRKRLDASKIIAEMTELMT